MSRHQRRADAAKAGVSWDEVQQRRRLARAERAALALSPEKAREILARWAARTGHTIEEVEKLNGQNQAPVQG